jgi:hypothetical protein
VRQRCTTHDAVSSEPETILAGPAHAAAAIRLSCPPAEGPAVVVLLCDCDHRLLLAMATEGAPPSGVRPAVDVVLAVAPSAGVTGIVVGIVQERLGQYLPKPEAESLRGLIGHCAAAGVDLLDLLLVGPRGWRSLYSLAEGPEGGEDGAG